MSENKKPRIAEILGVEVGERFSVEGQRGGDPLYIGEDGLVRYVSDDGVSASAIQIAINHPDRIIRKPRWMDDEIEFVKLFQASCKNKIFFERLKGTGILVWGEEGLDPVANSVLPYKLLPSLKEGERATASEIIGGAE